MQTLIDLLQQLQAWHWLSIGILLIAIDSLFTGGFLLGCAASAFIVWLLKMLFADLSWEAQLSVFSILSLILTAAFNHIFENKDMAPKEAAMINNRAAQLIGREIKITHDIPKGQSRLQIGDTLWKIESEQAYKTGDKIIITNAKGMTLMIEKQ